MSEPAMYYEHGIWFVEPKREERLPPGFTEVVYHWRHLSSGKEGTRKVGVLNPLQIRELLGCWNRCCPRVWHYWMDGMNNQDDDTMRRKRTVKVTFEDGNSLTTTIDGSKPEVNHYYLAEGQCFNFGDTEECAEDKLLRATEVEFLD